MDDPFEGSSDAGSATSLTQPSAWPLWVLWGLSAGGVVVALFSITLWSLIGWVTLVVATFVLLFRYRVSLVAATQAMDADAAVVGIKAPEKITIVAVVIACVANGIVLGLEVGAWPVWVDLGLAS